MIAVQILSSLAPEELDQLTSKWTDEYAESILGVDLGFVSSEEAFENGFETENWTLDGGIAPINRDWVSQLGNQPALVYVADRKLADQLTNELKGSGIHAQVVEIPDQDWNATWQSQFKGIVLPCGFEIVPPWLINEKAKTKYRLCIDPGAGFGTGTHETTQLCLSAIYELPKAPISALDFGAGSGILGFGLKLLHPNTQVVGVEIDPMAIENAEKNAKLNGLDQSVPFFETIPKTLKADLIIANILRPILIDQSSVLNQVLQPGGIVIFSGLVAIDLDRIYECFKGQLGWIEFAAPKQLNEWFCLQFQKPTT